jgi:hypothetical protein
LLPDESGGSLAQDAVTVAAVLGHEDASVTLRVYAARFNKQRKDDLVRAALAASSLR